MEITRAIRSAPRQISRSYAIYALLLLTSANILNYVDRNIISIVAASMQKELLLSDAQLGFLLGTSFAVLYGIFGITMGRVADAISRPKLMGVGLSMWSIMTALSSGATSFGSLAGARIGVGVGEAVATPCARSMLTEFFPPRNRAAVLSVYLLGSYLGIAGSLIIGGYISQNWEAVCSHIWSSNCRIGDWRAAFLFVGLPGLLLGLPIALLREPGEPRKYERSFSLVVRELAFAMPPFTMIRLKREGGTIAVLRNAQLAFVTGAVAIALSLSTGDWAQWVALGLGAYSVLTWAQFLKISDRSLHRLTFGCPTFLLAISGGAVIATVNATIGTWAAPYALRELHASPAEVGKYLGSAVIVASIFGSLLGGVMADRWKQSHPRAPV